MGAAATTATVPREPGELISEECERQDTGLTLRKTESLFHTYSQFASTPNLPPKPSEDEQRTEAQIQDLLDRVSIPLHRARSARR